MSDLSFRQKSEPVTPEVLPEKTDQAISTSNVEVPALDYEKEHGKPLSVDYFQLGNTWNDPDGGFGTEVSTIEGYFKKQIESGKMANKVTAIKERLKEIEKMTNTKKEERQIMKLAKISAYIKFLMETDEVESNLRKYSKY